MDLSGLNAQQRQAVLATDSPCLVLAGAGSGKTRVITTKIVHLIEQGLEARNIAALTFTNKAANEMLERTKHLVSTHLQGKKTGGLTICTFHALGVKIVRQEAAALGLKPGFSILDSTDAYAILQELLATTDKQRIWAAQQRISLWKNALVEPVSALAQARGENEATLARAYAGYDKTLRAYQAVDFDDLIRLPAQLFAQNDEVRDRWQSKIRYLLVDEYQDTNACQYALLRLISGPRQAFTLVGDDDQAIYGWRGATVDNLAQVAKDYPRLQLIKLEQNYRSTQRILNAANSVIANNPKLFDKKLWSQHNLGDAIHVAPMDSDETEAQSIAMRLMAHKFEHNAKFEDYAVLYRSHYQSRVIEQAFRKAKIPYVISGGQSFFERAEIRDLIAYLRLIANQDDDPAFIRAITTPKRGVGSSTLEALGSYAGQRGISLFEAAHEAGAEQALPARGLSGVREFCQYINRLNYRASREPADAVFNDMLKAIGYEAYLYDNNDERTAQTRWQNVLDFAAWIKGRVDPDEQDVQDATGEDVAQSERTLLQATQSVMLLTMLDKDNADHNAVRLSTLHAAKGLEYPHVFLVGVEEGLLPHLGKLEEDEDSDESSSSNKDNKSDAQDNWAAKMTERIAEERRLMYVGITRAQRSLTVSWCRLRKRAREIERRSPSRFIEEMGLKQGDASQMAAPSDTRAHLANLRALLNKPAAKTE